MAHNVDVINLYSSQKHDGAEKDGRDSVGGEPQNSSACRRQTNASMPNPGSGKTVGLGQVVLNHLESLTNPKKSVLLLLRFLLFFSAVGFRHGGCSSFVKTKSLG